VSAPDEGSPARTSSSSDGSSPSGRSRRTLALVLGLLGGIVVGGVFVGRHAPLDTLGARLEGSGPAGLAGFLVAGALATAVGLPRQGLAFVAGLAWGTTAGLALSLVAAIGGCALTLEASRRWLHRHVRARHPAFVDTLTRLVRRDAFAKVIALRLQPFGTNLLTNLCAGLTPMPRGAFLAASLIGYVPQMLVFALLGSGVRIGSGTRLLASAALLLVSLAIGAVLYRRHVRSTDTPAG